MSSLCSWGDTVRPPSTLTALATGHFFPHCGGLRMPSFRETWLLLALVLMPLLLPSFLSLPGLAPTPAPTFSPPWSSLAPQVDRGPRLRLAHPIPQASLRGFCPARSPFQPPVSHGRGRSRFLLKSRCSPSCWQVWVLLPRQFSGPLVWACLPSCCWCPLQPAFLTAKLFAPPLPSTCQAPRALSVR